jgi:uncharacterized repeat protein (TIGR02543 family)
VNKLKLISLKKVFSVAITSVFLLSFSAIPAQAATTVSCSGGGFFTYTGTTIDVESGTSCVGTAVIPNTITRIPIYAFSMASGLTAVTIGTGVTRIDDYAFFGTSLSSVTIPNNVQTLGNGVFESSPLLTTVSIGTGLTTMGAYTFGDSRGALASVTFEGNAPTVGAEPFYGKAANAKVFIKYTATGFGAHGSSWNGLTVTMNRGTFHCSTGVASSATPNFTITDGVVSEGGLCDGAVVVPSTVTSIDDEAFYSSNLTSISIPSSVTDIGTDAFAFTQSLQSVTFANPSSTTPDLNIGDNAFHESGIEAVQIPARATTIGIGAFSYNQSLSTVTFASPDSTSPALTFGNYSFNRSGLAAIEIPRRATTIGIGAFYNNQSLSAVTFASRESTSPALTFGNYSFNRSALAAIEIPRRATTIGEGAFYYNRSLEAVSFASPDSTSPPLTFGLESFSSSALTTIQIPARVTAIGNGAFYNAQSLSNVTFASPSSVETIGDYAFADAYSLTSISIPAGVTSIGKDTFSYATSLNSITIPANVEEIDDRAFLGTDSLAKVRFTGVSKLKTIGNNAFRDSRLAAITIPATVTGIGNNAFRDSRLSAITIPADVENIGDFAFLTSSLTSFSVDDANIDFVEIDNVLFKKLVNNKLALVAYPAGYRQSRYTVPANVSVIYPGALANLSALSAFSVDNGNQNLKAVNGVLFSQQGDLLVAYPAGKYDYENPTYEIPAGVTSIWDFAFYRSSISSVTFEDPSVMQEIGNYAFAETYSLSSFPFADTTALESIGERAFAGSLITSVTIPASVVDIGDYAFADSYELTNFTFADSSTPLAIGDMPFAFANLLTQITIPARVTSIGDRPFEGANSLALIRFEGTVITGNLGPIELPSTYREGYTFDGWYSDANFTTRVGDENTDYREYQVVRGQTLYAKLISDTPIPVVDPPVVVTTPAVVATTPATVVDAAAADLAARTIGFKKKYSVKALAKIVGVAIVSPKAKVTVSVSKTSKKICAKSGSSLKTLKAGTCEVTFKVQEPKPKKGKKPKATKTVKTLVVQ